jgi:hypothetical protein
VELPEALARVACGLTSCTECGVLVWTWVRRFKGDPETHQVASDLTEDEQRGALRLLGAKAIYQQGVGAGNGGRHQCPAGITGQWVESTEPDGAMEAR